jgi:hypothetical protein
MRPLAPCFLCAFLTLTGCLHAPQAKVMSWKEYSRRSGAYTYPYILSIQTSTGQLLYFGARHTYDPANPQISQIEKLWADFHPDVAFNEGGNPPTESSRDVAVSRYGEPGIVRFLAARDMVPVKSIDPTDAEEVTVLSRRFSSEQIKLYWVLRAVVQHVHKPTKGPIEHELERIFPIFSGTPGLNASPNSIAELQSIYARYFPRQGDFRETPEAWFDPVVSGTFLNEVSRQLSEYRDRYTIELLTRHVNEGKRVFAVVGGTHVIMQERAIRSLLHFR